MIEILQEIFQSIRRNKLRTTLTGISVSWGIFILIVLLGAGNGLRNAVTSNFIRRATNTISLDSGTTSKPYKGLKSNRNIEFHQEHLELIRTQVKEASYISPIYDTPQIISYKKKKEKVNVLGVLPDYIHFKSIDLGKDSRFINDLDIKHSNKVIVIDRKIAQKLFDKNESPIDKYVHVGKVLFKVIGVNSRKPNKFMSTDAYIPFSTSQTIFNTTANIGSIQFMVNGLNTEKANEDFNQSLMRILGRSLMFDPQDEQAIYIDNAHQQYIETMKVFGAINTFVAIIGILTLIAGVVGVSNIMLVSVKERTREIGIRKAIGASSSSILKSIIMESILITTIFGYIGMMFGIGLTEMINFFMEMSARASTSEEVQLSVFKNPTVELSYVFLATTILIIAGVIAGYMPASKAVKIKPIEAMREN